MKKAAGGIWGFAILAGVAWMVMRPKKAKAAAPALTPEQEAEQAVLEMMAGMTALAPFAIDDLKLAGIVPMDAVEVFADPAKIAGTPAVKLADGVYVISAADAGDPFADLFTPTSPPVEDF
jgi:hypothetical protein